MRARLLACILLLLPPVARAQTPELDPRDAARREAWKYARLVVATLEQDADGRFPAIRAWLGDFQRVAVRQDAAAHFPAVHCDALLTRNPRFWAAYYQIPPGDPGLALLHSALLLCGGEAQRATVIATLGMQRPALAPEYRYALSTILAHAADAQAGSIGIVREGVKRRDAHDFEGALKKYDEAIRHWPGNSWAHYERAFTLRAKVLTRAGKTPATADPPETLAALAAARLHDPFQVMAYQGADQAVSRSFMPLLRKALPAWDAIRRRSEPAPRETLAALAEACREAGIDEYALAARQALVANAGRYQPQDHAFIAECLRRLAPGAPTEGALRLLAASPPLVRAPIAVPADHELMRAPPQPEFLGPPVPPVAEPQKSKATPKPPKPKPRAKARKKKG